MLKYQLIANQIESHIYENNLPKGTKLPTVEQFASDYSVSKSTIVKALESLVPVSYTHLTLPTNSLV